MKTLNYIIALLILMISFTACESDEPIAANPDFVLSFQRDGQTTALAGTPFYVIPTGSGEFITLFDGNQGRVYGQENAKGIDFNKADSMMVSYAIAGTYKLTVVTTSTGDFGKTVIRKEKTIDIQVVDDRNTLIEFFLNIDGVDRPGTITSQNEVLFSIPDIYPDKNFKAIFKLDTNAATVLVNGQVQTSNLTINDFSQPVIYKIRSSQGSERSYTVRVSTFPPSAENRLLKFELGKNEPAIGYTNSNGERGIINDADGTIQLAVNYATVTTSLKFSVESSPFSTVLLNGVAYSSTRRNYNIATTIRKVTVMAQNKAIKEYDILLSLQNPVNTFTFTGLVPAPVGIINTANKTISVDVLKGTDITKLVAQWEGSVGTVRIGSVNQINGTTPNDFSTPKVYTFFRGTTAGDSYTVTVNVK
jgi:hypothetical protein